MFNNIAVRTKLSTCVKIWFDLIFGVYRHFQQYFSYIMGTCFTGGIKRCTRTEPPPMGKQLVNFITCAATKLYICFPTFNV